MSNPPAMATRSRLQPAWLMLGGAFTTFAIGAALMQSYTVYLVAFIEEFGWSRAETSLAYSVSQWWPEGVRPLSGRSSTDSDRGDCCCSAGDCWFSGWPAAPW